MLSAAGIRLNPLGELKRSTDLSAPKREGAERKKGRGGEKGKKRRGKGSMEICLHQLRRPWRTYRLMLIAETPNFTDKHWLHPLATHQLKLFLIGVN